MSVLPMPRKTTAVLAKILFREMNEFHPKRKTQQRPDTHLEILSGMHIGELKALANAVLTPGRQRRLHNLLRKNQVRTLSEQDDKELNELLEEVDRIALLKAKAMYTLSVLQQND